MARQSNKNKTMSPTPPDFERKQIFDDIGFYGLRQFSGHVREEFLPQLAGRQAQRVYREMLDNSSVVGAVMFAIQQSMRKVTWRVEPPNDSAAAKAQVEFVESLMADMSHTWPDFIAESLSMLGYGFAAHEIVYKRRTGPRPHSRPGPKASNDLGSSKFNDGKIGWRRLPGRGQDTIIKWFIDDNGSVQGLTQQPYVGQIVDIPIEKLLLFRPSIIKNNPEGRSILRNAYRPYFFIKRLEEIEAISAERMNGFPVLSIPSELIERATAAGPLADPIAAAAYSQYKKIATNIRVDEQMGLVLPSDVFNDSQGKPSSVRQYGLELLTPQHAAGSKGGMHEAIERKKVEILMTVLADFIQMGHEVRGTNNLAVTKVDMFYQGIEAWLTSIGDVLNRYALPRLWALNGENPDLMPQIKPDMSQRLDLDSLGAYVASLATAGMPLFPDDDLQTFLREAGGMPEKTDPAAIAAAALKLKSETTISTTKPAPGKAGGGGE